MALSDYSTADQQIIRTVIGAEGAAPSNEELVQYQAYVAANSLNALSNLIIAEDAALLSTAALADQIVANFGAIEATGVKDQATAYVLGRLNKEGADVGAIIAQIATVLGDPDLSGNLNPIYLPLAATFQATTEAGLVSSAVEEFSLTTGLAAVATAEDAVAAFIAANAVETDDPANGLDAGDIALTQDNAEDANDDAELALDTLLAAATDTYGDLYAPTEYDTASAGVQASILSEIQAEQAAGLVVLQAAQADAQAGVAGVAGLQALINTRNAADEAEVVAATALTAAEVALAEAVAAFGVLNADGAVAVGALGIFETTNVAATDFFEIVDGDLVLVGTQVLGSDVTEENFPGIEALLAASIAFEAAEQAVIDTAATTLAADNAVDAAGGGTGAALDTTLEGAIAAVVAQQLVDTNIAAAVATEVTTEADLAAANAVEADLAELNQAVVDANAAITAEFDNNTNLTVDASVNGVNGQDDMFRADSIGDGKTVDITVFGNGGVDSDVLYLGDVTFNAGVSATDGDNAVLEYFLTEVAGDTFIQVETSVFGSNTAGQAETSTIELTGLTIDQLSIVDGQVTLA